MERPVKPEVASSPPTAGPLGKSRHSRHSNYKDLVHVFLNTVTYVIYLFNGRV